MMIGKTRFGVILLVGLSCSHPVTLNHEGARPRPSRAQAGEKVRIVRFTVKPKMRTEFEEFFWNSLKPAAERQAADETDLQGSFRLLIPESLSRNGNYTYYVIVDPISGDAASGETMRDMVRAAFPGEEGQRRVQRWMSSIVLGDLAPVGEVFVEADLKAERRPGA